MADKKPAKAILFMLLCSFCLCLGQLVWKLMPDFNWLYVLSSFALFGIGAVLMIISYRYGELSVLQPINSMTYVYSLFLGYAVFNEEITVPKIAGVAAIMSGVILLGRSSVA